MAIIKKQLFPQDLEKYSVFLDDTDPKSKYFKVTQLPDIFTGGKNAFLIQGSEHLVKGSNLLIEIKDSNGNVIYNEPANGIPEYYEGVSKPVAVYIYPDTSYGPCTITILGELFEYELDGKYTTIPNNWTGRPNVKWQANVNVNATLANTTPVRFFKRPKIDLVETGLPIFNIEKQYNNFSANVRGFSVQPNAGTQWPYAGNTVYRLQSIGQNWPQTLVNTTIYVSNIMISDGNDGPLVESNPINYFPLITEVNDSNTVTANIPYVKIPVPFQSETARRARQYPQIYDFEQGTVSLTYESSSKYIDSGISSSYVRINISDLETFSGDVYRLKVFSRSKNDLQGYKLLEDLVIEAKEFYEVDYYLNKINKKTGIFDSQDVINDFWTISPINDSSATTILDTTNKYGVGYCTITPLHLGESDSAGLVKFSYIQPFDFIKNTEYILSFNAIFLEDPNDLGILEVYASGSSSGITSPFINSNDEYKLGKKLAAYTTDTFRKYDKQYINFTPDRDGSGYITFNIRSGKWSISDISLTPAKQSSFSPNEISFLTNPHIQIVSESFDFKFEFFDINYNYIPVKIEKSATFQGGNDIIPRLTLKVWSGSYGAPPIYSNSPLSFNNLTFKYYRDQYDALMSTPYYYDFKIERFNTTNPIEFFSSSRQVPQVSNSGIGAYDNYVNEINPYLQDIDWFGQYPGQAYIHEASADGIPPSTEDEKWFRIYGATVFGDLNNFSEYNYVDRVNYMVECGNYYSTLNQRFTIGTNYDDFVFPTTTTSTTTSTTTVDPNRCNYELLAYFSASNVKWGTSAILKATYTASALVGPFDVYVSGLDSYVSGGNPPYPYEYLVTSSISKQSLATGLIATGSIFSPPNQFRVVNLDPYCGQSKYVSILPIDYNTPTSVDIRMWNQTNNSQYRSLIDWAAMTSTSSIAWDGTNLLAPVLSPLYYNGVPKFFPLHSQLDIDNAGGLVNWSGPAATGSFEYSGSFKFWVKVSNDPINQGIFDASTPTLQKQYLSNTPVTITISGSILSGGDSSHRVYVWNTGYVDGNYKLLLTYNAKDTGPQIVLGGGIRPR